jgi:hypothetical protein
LHTIYNYDCIKFALLLLCLLYLKEWLRNLMSVQLTKKRSGKSD